jgi:5-deoxy-D-glucuronate isomerase
MMELLPKVVLIYCTIILVGHIENEPHFTREVGKTSYFFIYTLVCVNITQMSSKSMVNLTKSERATNQPPSHGSRRKIRINQSPIQILTKNKNNNNVYIFKIITYKKWLRAAEVSGSLYFCS